MKRLAEFITITGYRLIEFKLYTICDIEYYRNYSRFYWGNIKGGNKWIQNMMNGIGKSIDGLNGT